MSNLLFPKLAGLAWGSVWTPIYRTSVQTAKSGKEYRSALMASPVYEFSLKYEFLRTGKNDNEVRTLMRFYMTHKGAYESFLYENPEDNHVDDQLIGMADGNVTAFQLLRGFDLASVEPVKNIKQIEAIKVAGITKTFGIDYTVTDKGVVVFQAAPMAGAVTWSGSYYYRARFVDDSIDFEKFMRGIYRNNKIVLRASLGEKV